MPDLDILVFHAGGVTRGARNIALPLLRRTPKPSGLAKDVAVSAAMWLGSHGMRSTVNVSRVVGTLAEHNTATPRATCWCRAHQAI